MLGLNQMCGFGVSAAMLDEYWNNVVLLMHMDGIDNGTTFIDEKGHLFTRYGTPVTSTGRYKYGTTSLLTYSAKGHINTPSSSDFMFGAGDFTIECYVNYVTAPNDYDGIIGRWVTGVNLNDSWYLSATTTGFSFALYQQAGSVYVGTFNYTIVINTWYHVAVSRVGNVLRMFVNGNQIGSDLNMGGVTLADGTYRLEIGGTSENSQLYTHNGYIDEVRITKGIGRYSTNFTAPTAPFSVSL